jgi:hypothetical protein
VDCDIDFSEIDSDAYNFGISFKKTNINFSKFFMGCCGANFTIDSTRIFNSTFSTGMGNPVQGLVSIKNTLLYNTIINLPHAEFFVENSIVANYNSGFAISMGNGVVKTTTFAGNGNSSGLRITGYAG